MKRNDKGAIDPLTVTILAGACIIGVFIPNARPWNWFQKDQVAAANKQLITAQADLEKAKLEAKQAQDALEGAKKAELAKKDSQIGYAQQMALGAKESLLSATPEPPVRLAISLLDRTNTGLASAIGSLPQDKQAEIVKIVNDTLAGTEAELQAAKIRLAQLDHDFTVASTERDSLKKTIPALQTSLASKEQELSKQTQVVADKTQLVVVQAEKIAAKEKESGSLTAQLNTMGRYAIIAGILYLFAHFLLPSLSQEYPNFSLLGNLNKTVKSLTSSHQ